MDKQKRWMEEIAASAFGLLAMTFVEMGCGAGVEEGVERTPRMNLGAKYLRV